ncbi:MAG: hypothetical protein ACNS64_01255 [Candidatus Halalkalibacterium sp. M3_1C_030]
MEITGNKDLLSKMPTKVSDFQDNYQRILLDVYDVDAGGWVQRDTLFAEDTGKIEGDKGEYRNDQLFGLQKTVGREKVENIGPINGDVGDIVDALVTASSIDHVVQTNGTLPSVTNYTFNGNIDNAIRDLMRDYPGVLIWWTGQTDGSDNQIVKVEEKGVNASTVSITYPDPNYEVIEYEEEDTSIVVNRATVRGTNANGDLIEVDTDDFATGQLATDIQTSKDNFGERSLPPRNVGYLEDQAHAEEIAKNLLQLEAQPHLVVSLPFQDSNILNQDIDITDSRYNINDTFTVVKQRDFYLDSKTEVELVFEKNLAEERRAEQRDISEERARVYPSGQAAVTGQTSGESPDTGGQVGNTSPNTAGQAGNTSPNTAGQAGNTSPGVSGITDTESTTENTDIFPSNPPDTRSIDGTWNYMGQVDANSTDVLWHLITMSIDSTTNNGMNIEVAVVDGNEEFVLAHWEWTNLGDGPDAGDLTTGTTGDNNIATFTKLLVPDDIVGTGYRFYVATQGGASGDITYNLGLKDLTHDHDASQGTGTLDTDYHPHSLDTGTTDGNNETITADVDFHPHSIDSGTTDGDNQTITADVDFHPHSANTGTTDGDGSTITIDVDTHPHYADQDGGNLSSEAAQEDKTDR